MNTTCGNCRFFLLTNPGGGVTASGQCRIRSVGTFPVRLVDESCGEHQPVPGANSTRTNVTLMESSLPENATDRQEAEAWRRAAVEQFPHPGIQL